MTSPFRADGLVIDTGNWNYDSALIDGKAGYHLTHKTTGEKVDIVSNPMKLTAAFDAAKHPHWVIYKPPLPDDAVEYDGDVAYVKLPR